MDSFTIVTLLMHCIPIPNKKMRLEYFHDLDGDEKKGVIIAGQLLFKS